MKKNQNAESDPELDAELAEVEKMSGDFMDLDEDQDEEEQETPKEDEEGDDDSPKDDEEEEDDSDDDDDDDEDADSDDDEEEDSDEEDDDSEDDEEEDGDGKKKKGKDDNTRVSRNRPEKYVPVKKYQSEKKAWSEDKTRLEGEIATLKEQLGGMSKEETDEVVKQWAEDNDVDIAQAQGLVDLIKKSTGIDDLKEQLSKISGAKEEDTEAQEFEQEWGEEISPILKEEHPNASKSAIKRAQKRMDELAHTRRYASHPLEDIYKLNKDEFGKILNTKAPKKGPVNSSRPGASKKDATTMSFEPDKNTGKYDFGALHKMKDGPEKDKVIEGLSPEAYSEYIDDLDDDTLEVSRGGRKVDLD